MEKKSIVYSEYNSRNTIREYFLFLNVSRALSISCTITSTVEWEICLKPKVLKVPNFTFSVALGAIITHTLKEFRNI